MATRYLKITINELQALIDTAETCESISGEGNEGMIREADRAKKAYNAVLKRSGLEQVERERPSVSIPNASEHYNE